MGRTVKRYEMIKVIVIIIAAVLLISLLFAGIYVLDQRHGEYQQIDFTKDEISYNGKQYVRNSNVESFLVICLDKFEDGSMRDELYRNDRQADFLMLFVFDNEKKTSTAIQINRDTMVEMNILGLVGNKIGTDEKQIALAHTYGNGKEISCVNTTDAVSNLLQGVHIDHYASLTMDAVPIMNDLVGGVTITVLDDFTGIDDTLIKDTEVTLHGDKALTYIRTREGLEDSTNAHRMIRQQQYINALYDKVEERMQNDTEFILTASVSLADFMVSDRSVNQLETLAGKFDDYEFLGIRDIDGESKVGEKYMEFYANEGSVEKLVVELFYQVKE